MLTKQLGYTYSEYLDRRNKRWIAAAITAAASIGTAIYNGIQRKKAAKKAREESLQDTADAREWQEQMTDKQNSWNLQQWNRELAASRENAEIQNAYNSPEAQRDRLLKAGYNPLNTELYQSAPIDLPSTEASSIPSAEMPQVYNQGMTVEGVQDAFMQWSAQRIQEKSVEAQNAKLREETQSIAFQRMRDGLQFGKQFEFMGVQIDLAKSQMRLTEKQASESAQRALELEQQIKMYRQYMAESGARMNRMAVQNACDQLQVDNACRKLVWDIWFTQKQGWNVRQDTLNKYDEHLINQRTSRRLDQDIARHDYSPISLSVMRGMDVVSSILEPAASVSKIGMVKSLVKSGYKSAPNYMGIMQASTPNR